MLAPAAAATALPGDEPIVQLGPEDNAAVPANRDGIEVRFICPGYIISTSGPGLTNYGDYTDYAVDFATSPALGVDGRLLGTSIVAYGNASRSNAGVDQCTSAMFANPIDRVPGPQDTPGTYYWQVNLEEDRQRRRVQRARRGGGGLAARAPLAAPAAQVGDELGLSSIRTVRVSAARTWSTTRADDGRYTGRAEGSKVSLRVAGGGRLIRDFTTNVTALCIGPTVEQNRIAVLVTPLRKARIAPDGRFFGAARAGKAIDVTIRGRLGGGRIRGGQVEVSLSACTGSAKYSARRAGG